MKDAGKWSLPGGAVVWVFAVVELVTFGLFFLGYAWSYADSPAVFRGSQALVHPLSGAVNTAVLLTASWAAARARSWRWWLLVGGAGLLFLGIKGQEYAELFGLGLSLGANSYWFFYLFLTFFHALHVLAGVLIAGVVAARLYRRQLDAEDQEAAAIYWHVVDLIWILLFPLLYLLTP